MQSINKQSLKTAEPKEPSQNRILVKRLFSKKAQLKVTSNNTLAGRFMISFENI